MDRIGNLILIGCITLVVIIFGYLMATSYFAPFKEPTHQSKVQGYKP